MEGLKLICKTQVMEEVLYAINGTPAEFEERAAAKQIGYKVLVVDHFSTRIISSCCKMSGIAEAGVSHVENLHVRRQPLPQEAIYFVSPRKESVDTICKDFEPRKQPQYARAHIIFTGHLSDLLMQQIAGNATLTKRIATLKELNMEFMAVEEQVFSLDMPECFYHLYAQPTATPKPNPMSAHNRIAERLASLCITLGAQRSERDGSGSQVPLIRFEQSSHAARTIAEKVHTKLENFLAANKDSSRLMQQNADRHRTGARAMLLVVDRVADLAAPLLHELTYQAMAQDLLEVSESGVIKRDFIDAQGEARTKMDILSEEDALWTQFKHSHMADISEELPQQFQDFQERSNIAQHQKKKADTGSEQTMDTKEMLRVVKELPQFRKLQDKYSMHINLTSQLLKLYKNRSLDEVCSLEMDMCFAADATGSKLRFQAHREAMAALLQTGGAMLTAADKARLHAIFRITNPNEAPQLEEMGGSGVAVPPEFSRAVENIDSLVNREQSRGLYVSRGFQTDREEFPRYDKGRMPTDRTSRFKPALYWAGKDAIDPKRSLSTDAYPYVEPPAGSGGSAGGGEPEFTAGGGVSRRTTGGAGGASKNWRGGKKIRGPRLLIFVVGGMGYSEVRSAYELMKKYNGVEVFIGSTELLTPETLLSRLALEEYVQPAADLAREARNFEDREYGGDGQEEELSAFDRFLDKLPFETVCPCCFPGANGSPLLRLDHYPTSEASEASFRDSQAEDRPLVAGGGAASTSSSSHPVLRIER